MIGTSNSPHCRTRANTLSAAGCRCCSVQSDPGPTIDLDSHFGVGRKRRYSLGAAVMTDLWHLTATEAVAPAAFPQRTYTGLACCSTATGMAKENIEPCPATDSTQIFPPCISIIRFELASSKPVPPFLRVIELSACWNSWNSLA